MSICSVCVPQCVQCGVDIVVDVVLVAVVVLVLVLVLALALALVIILVLDRLAILMVFRPWTFSGGLIEFGIDCSRLPGGTRPHNAFGC